jgi:hypothetical protein
MAVQEQLRLGCDDVGPGRVLPQSMFSADPIFTVVNPAAHPVATDRAAAPPWQYDPLVQGVHTPPSSMKPGRHPVATNSSALRCTATPEAATATSAAPQHKLLCMKQSLHGGVVWVGVCVAARLSCCRTVVYISCRLYDVEPPPIW